jgi:hypothetical protein
MIRTALKFATVITGFVLARGWRDRRLRRSKELGLLGLENLSADRPFIDGQ